MRASRFILRIASLLEARRSSQQEARPCDWFATRSRPLRSTVIRVGPRSSPVGVPPRYSWTVAPSERVISVVKQLPYRGTVDVSVLGPLRVEDVNGLIEIRGGKERLLLARLIAASGRLVTTSELIDTLWDDDPPASAAKSVQTFVLRLRNALEPHRSGTPAVLLTDGPGYRLALDPGQVDAERFGRLATIGRQALAGGRPDSAGRTLGEALALWRGPAYAGFDADFAHAEAHRLEELRLAVTGDRLAAELALGRASESVPELEQLVGDHPHRERFWEMLVTALYRSGRQGDALGAYERARTLLSAELGVDPGAGLRSVHARVLAHDRTLGQPSARSALPLELRPTGALVGRDGELQRLRDAWQRAVRGPPCTVVVRGPVGAGGSALAAAFAAEVAREGAEVRYAGPLTTAPASVRATEGSTLLVADHAPAAGGATLVLQLTGRPWHGRRRGRGHRSRRRSTHPTFERSWPTTWPLTSSTW